MDKLTSNNYSLWKFKLKASLTVKQLYGYVDRSTVLAHDVNAATKAKFQQDSSKTLSQVVLSVSDNLIVPDHSMLKPKRCKGQTKGSLRAPYTCK